MKMYTPAAREAVAQIVIRYILEAVFQVVEYIGTMFVEKGVWH